MAKEISLRPYPGCILLCRSLSELKREHRRITKQVYDFAEVSGKGGVMARIDGSDGSLIYLVWGCGFRNVVHELCHVLLETFKDIGHNPTEGDGEPFCYMLSALMDEI